MARPAPRAAVAMTVALARAAVARTVATLARAADRPAVALARAARTPVAILGAWSAARLSRLSLRSQRRRGPSATGAT